MKTVNVRIKGDNLLQDKPNMELIRGTSLKRKGQTIELPVEESLHRNGQGIYVPYEWLERCIKNASKQFKESGKRGGSYYKSISAAVRVEPEEIPLKPQKWGNFARLIRKKDGNRIAKISPMFENWSLEFQFIVDDWFDVDVLEEILIEAGQREGIGAWRPACGGRFGKFSVERFELN